MAQCEVRTNLLVVETLKNTFKGKVARPEVMIDLKKPLWLEWESDYKATSFLTFVPRSPSCTSSLSVDDRGNLGLGGSSRMQNLWRVSSQLGNEVGTCSVGT